MLQVQILDKIILKLVLCRIQKESQSRAIATSLSEEIIKNIFPNENQIHNHRAFSQTVPLRYDAPYVLTYGLIGT